MIMSGSQDITERSDEIRREVVDLDRLSRDGMEYRVAAHRFKFPDVPGPRGGQEAVANLLREHGTSLLTEFAGLLLKKDIRQGEDFVLSLRQTRKPEHKEAKSIAEIPPEEARLDEMIEVGVRGGNKPDVDVPSAHLAYPPYQAVI
jgi:hypothetical protein